MYLDLSPLEERVIQLNSFFYRILLSKFNISKPEMEAEETQLIFSHCADK